MALFIFSILGWKHLFWANLVEKIIIVSLSLNLAHRLIRIYRIQWWYSSFLSYNGNSLFEKRKLTKLDYRFCYRFCDYH